MKNRITEILKEIKAGKCILVVGPDVHDFGEKSFFEVFCQELPLLDGHERVLENPKTFSEYVFLNEELIQIKSEPKSEKRLALLVEEFYDKQTVLDEPLRKIAQIPFPMIISLMPDNRLRRVFDEQNLPYEFSYCPLDQALPLDIQPTIEKPLIYNLLGNLDEYETVITFDAMFRLLSNILKNQLPNIVTQTLSNAKAVLFLGVHFERWHTQLLLKIIDAGGFNYTISKEGKQDVSLFVRQRLQLDLLNNNPEQFFYHLYQACKDAGILKAAPARSNIGSVFISYSHHDESIANQVAAALHLSNITVVMDQTNLAGGDKIEKFMQEIGKVDLFIPLLSASSLFRPYVIQEIYKALSISKRILAGLVDNTLLEDQIDQIKNNIFEKAMGPIGDEIGKNIKNRIPHLTTAQHQWAEFNNNFSIVVDELRKIKNIPINPLNLEPFVQDVINALNISLKNGNSN